MCAEKSGGRLALNWFLVPVCCMKMHTVILLYSLWSPTAVCILFMTVIRNFYCVSVESFAKTLEFIIARIADMAESVVVHEQDYERICSLEALRVAGRKRVALNGRIVVLFYVSGQVYALDHFCYREPVAV